MSERWWRAYCGSRHDPKIMLLAPEMFRAWFILLCVAGENDGHIPSATEAAFALRVNESKAKGIMAFLAGKELFDAVPGGYFMPHNWNGRQYKSDVSTDRVKEFRERKRNGGETFHVTETKRPQIQSTESEKKEPLSEPSSDAHPEKPKKRARNNYSEVFEAFWKAYPTDGLMSKLEAGKAWKRLSAEDQTAAIAGVPGFIAHCRANPDYRPVHACRYLSQRRFEGFVPKVSAPLIAPEGRPSSEELRRKYANAAPVAAERRTEIPPVDASGAGPRPAKQQLGGHPARIGGARSVGSILQGLGLGAAGIQETRSGGNMHDADPVAGMAANGMGSDGDDSQDYPLQTEWPIQ